MLDFLTKFLKLVWDVLKISRKTETLKNCPWLFGPRPKIWGFFTLAILFFIGFLCRYRIPDQKRLGWVFNILFSVAYLPENSMYALLLHFQEDIWATFTFRNEKQILGKWMNEKSHAVWLQLLKFALDSKLTCLGDNNYMQSYAFQSSFLPSA